MKNKIIILLILFVCICVGCSVSDSNKNKKNSKDGRIMTEESLEDTEKTENSQTELKTEENNQDPSEDSSSGKITSNDIPDRDENVTSQAASAAVPEDAEIESSEVKQQSTLPSQSSNQENPSDVPSQEETSSNDNAKPDEKTEETVIDKAGADDEKEVAEKVLEYINAYREQPATKLSGLTGYAEYRSRQLVSNFAHDTNDQRAAATALQYGEYIDPKVFGGSGEPYYRANAREAIAKAGYAGSVDYVAQQLARLVYESASHWKYIGDSEYTYIAVGVTYQSDMWYCAITVAMQNTDEL